MQSSHIAITTKRANHSKEPNKAICTHPANHQRDAYRARRQRGDDEGPDVRYVDAGSDRGPALGVPVVQVARLPAVAFPFVVSVELEFTIIIVWYQLFYQPPPPPPQPPPPPHPPFER